MEGEGEGGAWTCDGHVMFEMPVRHPSWPLHLQFWNSKYERSGRERGTVGSGDQCVGCLNWIPEGSQVMVMASSRVKAQQ